MKARARFNSIVASLLAVAALSSPVRGQETMVVVPEDASRRFAKAYEVTTASARTEPGDAHSTITVEATGQVNTGGWSDAELAAWSYISPPEDGILDFDFIARMPSDDAIVTMAFEDLSARVSGPMPPWVKGVRIHASSNFVEVLLEGPINELKLSTTVGAPRNPTADEVLPWPWKFFTPEAE